MPDCSQVLKAVGAISESRVSECVCACLRASTCVSRPNMMIMMKKQTAQSCGTGIMDTALGKAMKASPGPVRTQHEQLVCARVRKYDPSSTPMPEM